MSKEKKSLIERWVSFFVDKYKISLLLILAMIVAGVYSSFTSERQDFPPIPVPYIRVVAVYPGASPSDVEQDAIVPLENELGSIEGIKNMRSTAANSFGSVVIELEAVDKKSIESGIAEINSVVDGISLSSDIKTSVEPFEAGGPTVAYGLVAKNGASLDELLELAPNVREYLEGASGEVKSIDVSPEPEKKVELVLDFEKMSVAHLTVADIQEALRGALTILPGGTLKSEEEKTITIDISVTSLENIENIQLGAVKLGDVASIERVPVDNEVLTLIGYVEDDEGIAQKSIYLMANKKDDGDVISLVEDLDAAIEEIHDKNILPAGVELKKVYDTSTYVSNQIDALFSNGLMGLVVILLVLLLFVNLRTGIVVALIIPLAFLITFAIFPALGFTLNILTLFAMILSLGILVDNAIVIAEGIMANIEKGLGKREAAIAAVKEFGPAVTAATVTTIIVFIPFASIGGIMGEFIKYIPYTVIAMLVASYFLAISITPLFGRWLLKKGKPKKQLATWQKVLVLPAIIIFSQRLIDWVVEHYGAMMASVFKKLSLRIIIVLITLFLMGTSFFIFAGKISFEEFPSKDGEGLVLSAEFPEGTNFETRADVMTKVSDEIVKIPHFQSFLIMSVGKFESMFYVLITDPSERKGDMTSHEIVEDLNDKLDAINDEIAYSGARIEVSASSYGPPAQDYDITVEFRGSDKDSLVLAANDLNGFIKGKDNVERIYNGNEEKQVSMIGISFDEDKLSENGVSPMMSSMVINSLFSETDGGKVVIREDGVSDDIKIRYQDVNTDELAEIRNILVPTALGSVVPLSEVASVEEISELNTISRLDGKRVTEVQVKLTEDGDRVVLEQEIEDYLTEDKMNEFSLDVDDVVYGGALALMNESYDNLIMVFMLSILFVYIVLVYQFNSFLQPVLIILTIPLALIGVFPGLFFVDSTLNMISGLGVIALVGIVVNDAIVFVDYYNRQRKEQGVSLAEALASTGKARFKPIFTTSITTIGGILPLTLLDPFWSGLGTSLIAGLIFSTIGTLIVIPVVIYMFTRKKKLNAKG